MVLRPPGSDVINESTTRVIADMLAVELSRKHALKKLGGPDECSLLGLGWRSQGCDGSICMGTR